MLLFSKVAMLAASHFHPVSPAEDEAAFAPQPDKFDAGLNFVSLSGPFVKCVEVLYYSFNLHFSASLQC